MFYSTLTAALGDIANRSFLEGATVTPALSHCGSAVAYQPDSDRQEWFCPSCHRVSLPCSLTEGYAVTDDADPLSGDYLEDYGDGDYAITLGDRCHRLPDVDPLNPPHERKDETMSTPYTCPACGHHITRGNPVNIHLHQIVSHSGKTPIVAQDTPAPAQ